MHALTLARQRLRARIQSPSTPKTVRLAHGLVENGQGQFLPVLSSGLAQEILTRGYDALTLDRVYSNRPAADLNLVGKIADRLILNLPVHEGLRERLQATVGEICGTATVAARSGETDFRVLCAPCGLGCEMVGVAERLRGSRPDVLAKMRFWGVDADRDGMLLRETARRTQAAGLKVRLIREDLRRHHEVRAAARREGLFHLVSCVGITQGFSLSQAAELVRFYSTVMAPGATLLIDRWQPSEKSKVTDGLGVRPRCDSEREFTAMLEAAGLSIEREHPSGEGGCVLVVARKPALS
jgi:hypothetical protein